MTNKELGAKLDRIIELLEKQQQNTFTILPQPGTIPANVAWDCSCAPNTVCMSTGCPRSFQSSVLPASTKVYHAQTGPTYTTGYIPNNK